MNIGVKFCGGCNPRYNRSEYLKKIELEHCNDNFEIAHECCRYDCLLVIGGCSSCCASYEQYDYDNIIKVWEPKEDILVFNGNKNEKEI